METVEQAAREYTKQYSVEPQSYTTVAADAFIAGAQWQSSNQEGEQGAAQWFDNNFDCYADTWHENDDTIPPTLVEGAVIPAITKEKFLTYFKSINNVSTTPPSPNQSEEK